MNEMQIFPQLIIPETLAAGHGPGNTDARVLPSFANAELADHMQADVLRGMIECKHMLRSVWGSRSRVAEDTLVRYGAKQMGSLDELLALRDFVSLHCPGGEANRHLIDVRWPGMMRKGALLINTAQGDGVPSGGKPDRVLRRARSARRGGPR